MNQAITSQAIAFDTHRFVKHLTQTGFTEQQAEVLVEQQVQQVQFLNANLVTRENLAAVEASLKKDLAETNERIARVETELKANIAQVEASLKKDLAVVEAGLKVDIAQAEASLKVAIAETHQRIDALKTELIKWVVGIMLGGVTLQTSLMFWLLNWLVG